MCVDWIALSLAGFLGLVVGGLVGLIWGYNLRNPKSPATTQDPDGTSKHWYDTKKGKTFANAMFAVVRLAEHEGEKPERGTYSNEEIARKFDDDLEFVKFLMTLPPNEPGTSTRSVASRELDELKPA